MTCPYCKEFVDACELVLKATNGRPGMASIRAILITALTNHGVASKSKDLHESENPDD